VLGIPLRVGGGLVAKIWQVVAKAERGAVKLSRRTEAQAAVAN
jgi:hypothetical protein